MKGLITEASPLTYPENASLAEENFVLNRDGSRQRRLGIDFETNAVKSTKTYTEGSDGDIEHFLWKNAGNVQNVDISVLKIGNTFWFYDNNAEAVSASTLNSGGSITVPGFDPTGSGNPVIYSYAFINGRMIIASGFKHVTILSYNESTDVVSSTTKNISVRDTFGIEDSRPIDERPVFSFTPTIPPVGGSVFFDDPVASGIHIYNLANQGWQDHSKVAYGTANPTVIDTDTISVFMIWSNPTLGQMPSNSDTIGNNLAGASAPVASQIGLFYWDEMSNPIYGTRSAPKGSVIFDNMFNRGATRASIVSGRSGNKGPLPYAYTTAVANATLSSPYSKEATKGGISTVTSYNGRMIYAVFEDGVTSKDDESPSFGDMIFYSQATDGVENLTKCYTDIDPTSVEDFALLDTDGGYITLSGIGTINNLEVLGSSLFVFADNGVWQINGGNSIFTPTNINVHRITNVGNINRKGIVVAENRLFYLSDAGLYQVSLSENDPSLPATVTNISQISIQAFFDGLSTTSKQKSVAQFDRYSNQVKWLFASNVLPDKAYYDTELILDLNLGSFYINTIKPVDDLAGTGTPYIVGYLERPTAIFTETADIVEVGGDIVQVLGDDVQIAFRSVDSSILSSNKYWVTERGSNTTLDFSVAEYKDLQFRDWGSVANTSSGFGADAFAFLLTGYLTTGDSSSNKRITYITTHFRRTERVFTAVDGGFEPDNPSSCLLTAQWEWTSSANAGRWSNTQEIYRLPRTFIPDVGTFDYGHEVVTTKNKLRGKGRALSLLFQTQPLKDCHLYGWSYEINSEVSV